MEVVSQHREGQTGRLGASQQPSGPIGTHSVETDAEGLIEVAKPDQPRRSLGGYPSALANRLVRTSMPGGVRGRGRDAPSYSISRPRVLLTPGR